MVKTDIPSLKELWSFFKEGYLEHPKVGNLSSVAPILFLRLSLIV